jgi:hypothetical protein
MLWAFEIPFCVRKSGWFQKYRTKNQITSPLAPKKSTQTKIPTISSNV